jgi:hypothetical protein
LSTILFKKRFSKTQGTLSDEDIAVYALIRTARLYSCTSGMLTFICFAICIRAKLIYGVRSQKDI